MALANLKTPFGQPNNGLPGAPAGIDFSQIAQQMQVDPNTRTAISTFFGDPSSRSFIQDSGNVSTAMARPDNPWTPGSPLIPPAAAPAQPGPQAPPPGADLAAHFMGEASPQTPANSQPSGYSLSSGNYTPPGMPEAPGAPPVYATAHDYAAAHPETVSMAPRPVTPMDNVHGAREAFLLAFLGLNKFGAGLEHQTGSYADEFLGRQLETEQAQHQYDVAQPQLKHQAEEAAYNNYLGQQEKAGEIIRNAANLPMLQRQQALLDKVRTMKESGKYATDQDLMNAIMPEAQTVPGMTPQMLQSAINSSKTLGSKYSLTRDPQTEAPIELTDRQGNKYSASNLPNDPEAQQMWKDATTAAAEKETTEENKEKRVAGYAADRQATAFENAQKTEGQKLATTHLADIRDAANQQQLMQDLLSGKKDPAGQTAAMFKMIGLEQPTGTHRIMPAEIEGIEHLGGLSDKLKQTLLNWKQGDRFSPDLVPDVVATAKTLTDNKIKQANDNLEDVHRTYGYKVNGADDNGRLDGRPSLYSTTVQTPAGGGNNHAKVATKQHISDYAKVKGISVDAATKEFTSAGYTIQ